MSVYCGSIECKYNSSTNRCTAKKIVLSSHSILTVWDGRQDFWRCGNYEMSEESRAIEKALKQMMGEVNGS